MTPPPGVRRPGDGVSERWAAWRAQVDVEAYDARWERMAAQGQEVHGEADFVASLGAGPVLDAGCGTGRLAIELARRGLDVVGVDLDPDMVGLARRKAPGLSWAVADLAAMRLDRRFPTVAMAGNVLLFARPEDHQQIVRTLAGHLEPGGVLVAGFSLEPDGLTVAGYDGLCTAAGLVSVDRWSTWDRRPFTRSDRYQVSVHRQPDEVTATA